jgi:hypothetical protein
MKRTKTRHGGAFGIALLVGALLACKSSPKAGESCKNEGEASCQDKGMIVTCKSGKWETVACKGPEGCGEQGAIVKCDETLAVVDDPCGSQTGDHYSCSTDKKQQLKCEAGKWKMVGKCNGPKGCEAKFPFVNCDNSVSSAGDPCSKDGDAACSDDGKSILECKNGKFEATQKCDGKCVASGLFVKCE